MVFVPELDAPSEKPFPFAYFIHIVNESLEAVTILARKWILKDDRGEMVVVEGDGVVGETPHLAPSERFSYNSYHVIARDSLASGAFFGADVQGKGVRVNIPEFTLKIPQTE